MEFDEMSREVDRQWRRTGRWMGAWFVFCGVLALGAVCGLGYLLFALVDWMGRH